MLTHPTIEQLEKLRFYGMADALRDQLNHPGIEQVAFMDRLGEMVDREANRRESIRLKSRLRRARLRQQACMQDIDYRMHRGLDRRLMLYLAGCDWIRQKQNVIITGPTGVGKSYIACALAHTACLKGFKVRYFRLQRMLEDVALARAEGRLLKLLRTLSRLSVLVVDDWGLKKVTSAQQDDLLEILDDRHQVSSTIATSQLPVERWHQAMENPTLADAILDRLVHNAHRIQLTGDSMRKQMANVNVPENPEDSS